MSEKPFYFLLESAAFFFSSCLKYFQLNTSYLVVYFICKRNSLISLYRDYRYRHLGIYHYGHINTEEHRTYRTEQNHLIICAFQTVRKGTGSVRDPIVESFSSPFNISRFQSGCIGDKRRRYNYFYSTIMLTKFLIEKHV